MLQNLGNEKISLRWKCLPICAYQHGICTCILYVFISVFLGHAVVESVWFVAFSLPKIHNDLGKDLYRSHLFVPGLEHNVLSSQIPVDCLSICDSLTDDSWCLLMSPCAPACSLSPTIWFHCVTSLLGWTMKRSHCHPPIPVISSVKSSDQFWQK